MVTRVPDSTSEPALNSGSAISGFIFLERVFGLVGFAWASGNTGFASVEWGSASVFSVGGAG